MNNAKGFGMLGFLIAVLLVGILMTLVLKQYTGTVSRAASSFSSVGNVDPANQNTPAKSAKHGADLSPARKNPVPDARPACEGKLVGNICVPTQMHSSQDDFDKLYK